jgi:predicted DNA-binding mobile mystery protein A
MKSEVRRLIRRGLDQRVLSLKSTAANAQRPARGWLRAVREAIGLKQETVAQKIGVTRPSYRDLEASEARGSIRLSSLIRAADAMDCEVVYFLVPRDAVAKTSEELALRHDPEMKHLHATEHSMALEGQAVGDLPPKLRSK